MTGIQDGTEKRWEQSGQERIFLWSSGVSLPVSGFPGSLSLLSLWQINTLPLDLTKQKVNVPWLWSELSGAPNFCERCSQLGHSEVEGNVTSSRPRYLPEGRSIICLYINRCSSLREDLNWSQWLSECVFILILDSFPVFDASKQKPSEEPRDFFYLVLFDCEQQQQSCLVALEDFCYKTLTDLVEINCSIFFSFLHLSIV